MAYPRKEALVDNSFCAKNTIQGLIEGRRRSPKWRSACVANGTRVELLSRKNGNQHIPSSYTILKPCFRNFLLQPGYITL